MSPLFGQGNGKISCRGAFPPIVFPKLLAMALVSLRSASVKERIPFKTDADKRPFAGGVPCAEWLAEDCASRATPSHGGGAGKVRAVDWLVEGSELEEHTLHAGDAVRLPIVDRLVADDLEDVPLPDGPLACSITFP